MNSQSQSNPNRKYQNNTDFYNNSLDQHCHTRNDNKLPGIRQFYDIKSGYNQDFPSYLQMKSINPNPLSHYNPHIQTPCAIQSILEDKKFKERHIKLIDLMKKDVKYIKNNPDVVNHIKSYGEIEFLEKRERLKSYFNPNNNKIEIELKGFLKESKDKVNKLPFQLKNKLIAKEMSTKHSLNSMYMNDLSNLHDYNLSEAYKLNENKLDSIERKEVEVFDCINYTNKSIKPDKIVKEGVTDFYKK